MVRKIDDDVFKLKTGTPKNKAEVTDQIVRDIRQTESDERAALTRKLREARLAREAAEPASAEPKKTPAQRPRFRVY